MCVCQPPGEAPAPSSSTKGISIPALARGKGLTQPGCPGVTVPLWQLTSGTAARLGRAWRIKRQQRLKDGAKPLEMERGKTRTIGICAGWERMGTAQRGQRQVPACLGQFLLFFFNVQGNPQSRSFIPALPADRKVVV